MPGADVAANFAHTIGVREEPLDTLVPRALPVDVGRMCRAKDFLRRRLHLHEGAVAGLEVRGREFANYEPQQRSLSPS